MSGKYAALEDYMRGLPKNQREVVLRVEEMVTSL